MACNGCRETKPVHVPQARPGVGTAAIVHNLSRREQMYQQACGSVQEAPDHAAWSSRS